MARNSTTPGERLNGTKVPVRLALLSLRFFFFLAACYLGFLGTFAPFFRASERPIAIACFREVTLPPFPPLPDRSVPRFSRRMARSTLLLAASPYFLLEPFLFAISYLLQVRL
jgi:hypothetical protein